MSDKLIGLGQNQLAVHGHLNSGAYTDVGSSATRDVGTTAGTVAAGDDSRIKDAVLRQELSNPDMGAAIVGFKQEFGVPRLSQDKLRDVVSVKDFGAVGDGIADDTDAIQRAFDAAAGKVLLLGPMENYSFSPAAGLKISSPTTIVSNGSRFTKAYPTDGYSFRILADNVTIDSLHIEVVGTEGAQVTERGVQLDGSNLNIGSIIVNGAEVGTGAKGGRRSAVLVGNLETDVRNNIRIGSIVAKNWDRPVVFSNLKNSVIGHIDIERYVRGVYIRDCKELTIQSGSTKLISPNVNGGAGENGILIESVNERYATEGIHINNFSVEDSGEHGYRLGGGLSMRNIWFTDCSSLRTGYSITVGNPDATGWHGGCGFKVLGGTSSLGNKHENIHFSNCVVEDCNIQTGSFPNGHGHGNFVGFQLTVCSYVQLNNCIVRKRDQTYSAGRAVEILAADHVTFSNCDFLDAYEDGVRIYEVPSSNSSEGWKLPCEYINFVGCNINGYRYPLAIQVDGFVHRNITMSGVHLTGGARFAVRVEVPTNGGDLEDCYFDFTHSNPRTMGSGHPVYGTANIKYSCVAYWNPLSTTWPQGADGSMWRDSERGTIRIRKNGSWRQLISYDNISNHASTISLTDINSAHNQLADQKIQGTLVWNGTENKMYRAMGPDPADQWKAVDGSDTITPVASEDENPEDPEDPEP